MNKTHMHARDLPEFVQGNSRCRLLEVDDVRLVWNQTLVTNGLPGLLIEAASLVYPGRDLVQVTVWTDQRMAELRLLPDTGVNVGWGSDA